MLRKLTKLLVYFLLTATALTAVLYAVDYAIFRIRVSTNRNPYGSFTVNRYYAIPQKNGRTQFVFDPPTPQTCTRTLFPRQDYSPCWYLARHTEQRIDM